ncbi:hypothetical protein HZC33_02765 [Candidatus Wolfebacteria bacterium]|nr:hypothetical protein [Candidatus Wolfebacteria bacterium]
MSNISRAKIVTSVLILGVALVYSYLAIFSSLPSFNIAEKKSDNNIFNPLFGKNPLQWVGNRIENKNSSDLSLAQYANKLDSKKNQENNFTENFVNTVFNRVQAGNLAQGGVNPSFPGDKEINGKFDLGLVEFLKDSEIKISFDNSKEAKIKYLDSLSESAKKDYGDFKKDPLEITIDVVKDLNPLSAKEAAEIYKNTAKDFLNIEAPSTWKNFHKDLVIYFKNGAVIYEAMAQYHKDPLKGYAAIEKAQDVLVQKGIGINSDWQEKYNEVK